MQHRRAGSACGTLCLALLLASPWPRAAHAASAAIIGAGIAGASAAYHLRKLQDQQAGGGDDPLTIDVFDAGDRAGGRARELVYKGQVLEVGASIIWENNFLLRRAAEELGLGVVWLNEDTSKGKETDAKQQQQKEGEEAGKEEQQQEGGQGEGLLSTTVGDVDKDDGPLAIWDGKQFVAAMGGSVWDTATAVWRWGPAAYLWGKHSFQVWKDNFNQIYDLQDSGEAFSCPDDLLQRTGLYDYTQLNAREHMQSTLSKWWTWGVDTFAEELAGGINRCNYNQGSSTMNALAGLVSFLPAAEGRVWAVKEGNSQLAARMLNASGATLTLHTHVASLGRTKEGLYTLTTLPMGEGAAGAVPQARGPYSGVIIAAPLELADLVLDLVPPGEGRSAGGGSGGGDDGDGGPDGAKGEGGEALGGITRGDDEEGRVASTPQACAACPCSKGCSPAVGVGGTCALAERQYATTITTFVVGGELQPSAFHVAEVKASTILVTEHADTDFSSISLKQLPGGEKVYKVFSKVPLPPARVTELFGPNATVLETKIWKAYPLFNPPERFDPFVLGPGLCYANALENSASAMEVAAIAGRNCALVLAGTPDLVATRTTATSSSSETAARNDGAGGAAASAA